MPNDLKKTYRLSNVWVREITLCANPAVPDAKFAIIKSDDAPDGMEPVIKGVKILKIDDDRKQVFGYALVPDREDSQGDVISKSEIEEAAHRFMQLGFDGMTQGDGTGLEHQFFVDVGRPIESVIDTYGAIGKSHGIEPMPGAWWIGIQVTSDGIWKSIKDGGLTGFSIGAYGKRENMVKALTRKPLKAVVDAISRLTSISKEGAESFAEVYTEEKFYEEVDLLFSSLRSSVWTIMYDDDVADKGAAIGESIDQFKLVVLGYANLMKATTDMHAEGVSTDNLVGGLTKAVENIQALITKVSNGDSYATGGTMSEKQITDLMELVKSTGEKVNTLATDVADLKKAADTKEPESDDGGDSDVDINKTIADLTTQVTGLVTKIDAMAGDVEILKKVPGTRTGDDAEPTPEGDNQKSEIKKTASGDVIPPANTGMSFRREFE